MGIIYGFEYSHRRYNEEEGEYEYLVDDEWQLKSELKEYSEELKYWEGWADEINPNEG